MDQSHDVDHRHAPEDSAVFDQTCPRCGTSLSMDGQLPLDREPPPRTVACPTCGYDVRLTSDPSSI